MQSWFTFELDGESCRVERESALSTLAAFLARLDPCFSSYAEHDAHLSPRLVVMGLREGERHRFRIVDAGLVLLPMLAGRQIWTPEGIRNAEPEHPVNLAFHKDRFECSGGRLDAVVALAFEGYYRPDLRRRGQVGDQFDAIATRSANVPAIRETACEVFASTEQLRHEAARRAERQGQESWVWTGRKDIFGDRFTRALFQLPDEGPLLYVDGAKNRFLRPGNLVELLKQMRDYPEATLIAGGTGTPARSAKGSADLISLEGVGELTSIETSEESWEIGAAASLTHVAEHIGRECLAFNKALRRFATRPVRNRATLGGCLAAAWPAGQLAPLLMALNARARLLSADGERDVPLSQFFVGEGRTLLQPGELIRSITLPRATEAALAARGSTSQINDVYLAAPRRTACTPYATAAFSIEFRERRIVKARLAYSGLGPVPQRAREAEEFLAGRTWGERTVVETLPVLLRSVEIAPPVPGRIDAGYLRQLVGTLFQKFHVQHPSPESQRPEGLTATSEFAKLDESFYEVPRN